MSKTPVRAALERLEAEGYLSISPQQGILVRELSVQDIADQYELRAAVEPFVLSRLAGRLEESQVDLLRENIAAQEHACERGDLFQLSRLDGEFHSLFCEFHGNGEISRMMSQLGDKILRVSVKIAERDRSRTFDSLEEHRRIADAVIAGDAELAAIRVVEHIDAGRRRLVDRDTGIAKPNRSW